MRPKGRKQGFAIVNGDEPKEGFEAAALENCAPSMSKKMSPALGMADGQIPCPELGGASRHNWRQCRVSRFAGSPDVGADRECPAVYPEPLPLPALPRARGRSRSRRPRAAGSNGGLCWRPGSGDRLPPNPPRNDLSSGKSDSDYMVLRPITVAVGLRMSPVAVQRSSDNEQSRRPGATLFRCCPAAHTSRSAW